MQYTIDNGVFSRYPDFMRAVIIADGIDNREEKPELLQKLRDCERHVRESLGDDFKEHPRLAAWAGVFRDMGLNPNKYPPSVLNLVKRVRSGKDMPYVNSLVAAFNCVSLKHLCPCGGDDLAHVQDGLLLTFAQGDENYAPLGQPDVVEHPPKGEIIYLDPGTKDVFCRAWCWKNGDKSKLAASTARAAVNIDLIPPMGVKEAESIAAELAKMLTDYCGASCAIHFLRQENPSFSF